MEAATRSNIKCFSTRERESYFYKNSSIISFNLSLVFIILHGEIFLFYSLRKSAVKSAINIVSQMLTSKYIIHLCCTARKRKIMDYLQGT